MERASTASDGAQANSASNAPALNADGRYLAFTSLASNLVPGDTNGTDDVFVKDFSTGSTTLVSTSSAGVQGAGGSTDPALSADGQVVVFGSVASNLVPGDTNGAGDVFVKDLASGTTTRVSTATDGTEGNAASGWLNSAVSADGRHVAFWSGASNLVEGDTNGTWDVFVKDLATGVTTRVSTASDGAEGNSLSSGPPAISGDGRLVAFMSNATNLVPGDTNERSDLFVKDLVTGTTIRVNTSSDGTETNQQSTYVAISGDGRYVAFDSYATNLVAGDTNGTYDVFVKDLATGTTTRVSTGSDGTQANSWSQRPTISANGRWVVFESFASNLVPGDSNDGFEIFVKDLATGTTARATVNDQGVEGNGSAQVATISADGHYVAFASNASNLVGGDTNWALDVFRTSRP